MSQLAAIPLSPPRDRHGRPLRDLRISVMDRCNFRCAYCMPESTYHEHFQFLESRQRLSFGEIVRIAELAARLGVTKLRLTGGEPLLRARLPFLVEQLRQIRGIEDIAMTTNGVLLGRQAQALREAGLDRVTVSLDSLEPDAFARLSGGRGELQPVLDGIEAARKAGFPGGIKLNSVIQRGVNEDAVIPLLERFRGSGVIMRFIEYMDVGNHNDWHADAVVASAELLRRIESRWPLRPLSPQYRGEVAERYAFRDGAGEIGFISSVSAPFCGDCSRARLSSDGALYTCLFAQTGSDLRTPLRAGASDDDLLARMRAIWLARGDRYSEMRAERRSVRHGKKIEMHYIGG